VIGSDLKGSQWIHGGPAKAIPRVDSRRIRLLHCNRTLNLDRLVRDMRPSVSWKRSLPRDDSRCEAIV
jgi:hypothetical protein